MTAQQNAPNEPYVYQDWTYNSSNPIVRYAHRTRFGNSVSAIEIKEGMKLLDYGCGDGYFLNQLASETTVPVELYGYEPYMESTEENQIEILKKWEDVLAISNTGLFDYVTCFEVLEHFSAERQDEALKTMHQALKPTGRLVISVPIESGLSSVVKNTIRRYRVHRNGIGEQRYYTLANVTKALFRRPIPEVRQGDGYLDHMGFYFQDLEKIISRYFEIETKWYSPFRKFGANFNSQAFFTVTPK